MSDHKDYERIRKFKTAKGDEAQALLDEILDIKAYLGYVRQVVDNKYLQELLRGDHERAQQDDKNKLNGRLYELDKRLMSSEVTALVSGQFRKDMELRINKNAGDIYELAKKVDHPKVKMVSSGHFLTSGGSDTETLTIPSITNQMEVQAIVCSQGAAPVEVIAAVCATDQIEIKFSADPSNDHHVSYLVTHP